MDRLKLYFGLWLLILFKIILCIGTFIALILFSPILAFTNSKTFKVCIEQFYENI